jgi:predicted translin family RNA/ssDNA-binding protein
MDNDLRQVLDLFSNSSDLIREHYRDDDEFRSMCRDYADALHAIKTWQQSDKAEASKRVKEYQSLVSELQQDIRNWLKKVKRKYASS